MHSVRVYEIILAGSNLEIFHKITIKNLAKVSHYTVCICVHVCGGSVHLSVCVCVTYMCACGVCVGEV